MYCFTYPYKTNTVTGAIVVLGLMPGAGLEPATPFRAATFKAAAYTNLAIRAQRS